MYRITPSNIDPFVGRVPGPLTEAQRRKAATMKKQIERNRIRMRLPESYDVVRTTSPVNPMVELPQRFVFACPVIACTPDRSRILVIAPDGSDYWTAWKK